MEKSSYPRIFLTQLIYPKPFIGLASVLGFFNLFQHKGINSWIKLKTILFPVFLIGGILFSAQMNQTQVSYEEIKQLIAILSSSLYGIYFIGLSIRKNYEQRLKMLMATTLGLLFSSLIWYTLKISETSRGYSWIKYYGSVPLILSTIQVITAHREKISQSLFSIIGLMLTALLMLFDAKGSALIVVVSFYIIGKIWYKKPYIDMFTNKKHFQLGIASRIFLIILSLLIISRLVIIGFFGKSAMESLRFYLGSKRDIVFRARPELSISIDLAKEMPFYGYGTPSAVSVQSLNSSLERTGLTIKELNALFRRVLSTGLNLHSWFFEIFLRGGYFLLPILIIFLIFLIRNVANSFIIDQYPVFFMSSLFCIYDFFFSPITWFTPAYVGLAICAGYCRRFLDHEKELSSNET